MKSVVSLKKKKVKKKGKKGGEKGNINLEESPSGTKNQNFASSSSHYICFKNN